jgi:hypothetical protein
MGRIVSALSERVQDIRNKTIRLSNRFSFYSPTAKLTCRFEAQRKAVRCSALLGVAFFQFTLLNHIELNVFGSCSIDLYKGIVFFRNSSS